MLRVTPQATHAPIDIAGSMTSIDRYFKNVLSCWATSIAITSLHMMIFILSFYLTYGDLNKNVISIGFVTIFCVTSSIMMSKHNFSKPLLFRYIFATLANIAFSLILYVAAIYLFGVRRDIFWQFSITLILMSFAISVFTLRHARS